MPTIEIPPAVVSTPTVAKPKPPEMWKVILHNDNHNEGSYVAKCLKEVIGLPAERAWSIMMTAHQNGKATATVQPLEIAEHYQAQLQSKNLTITLEKD